MVQVKYCNVENINVILDDLNSAFLLLRSASASNRMLTAVHLTAQCGPD